MITLCNSVQTIFDTACSVTDRYQHDHGVSNDIHICYQFINNVLTLASKPSDDDTPTWLTLWMWPSQPSPTHRRPSTPLSTKAGKHHAMNKTGLVTRSRRWDKLPQLENLDRQLHTGRKFGPLRDRYLPCWKVRHRQCRTMSVFH